MPQITCPHCRQPYDIPPEQWPQYQGQRINCTRCNQPFDVTGPSAPPPMPVQSYPGAAPGYAPAGYGDPYAPQKQGMSGGKVALLVCGIVFLVLLVVCGGLGSILIPSLNRAREQANRVKSANNLRQIGLAAIVYANTNQNHFPNDEKIILKTQDISIDVFVSPRGQTQKPTTGDIDKLGDWANANSDYAWVGAGLDNTSPGNVVLAYEKPDSLKEGIEVLFADGHVEWVPKPKSDAMVSELKQGTNPPPSLASP